MEFKPVTFFCNDKMIYRQLKPMEWWNFSKSNGLESTIFAKMANIP